jgi:hypothetical protein
MYVFRVSKDGNALDYAVITETHHPDYLSRSDLEEIYGEVAETDSGAGSDELTSYHAVRQYRSTRASLRSSTFYVVESSKDRIKSQAFF